MNDLILCPQVQHQKLHEQLLHSLNEQLQLNLMHQAQLMKDSSGKGSSNSPSINNHSLQTLLMQHQQIMQQIQLVQRQFALASVLQPMAMHQGKGRLCACFFTSCAVSFFPSL